MKRPKRKEIITMLTESNYIEQEYSEEALEDAIEAWDWAWKNRDSISVDYILTIHRKLAQRIAPKIAGKIRDCDVYIGGHRKWFLSETLIKEDLQEIVRLMNSTNFESGKEEEYTKHVHVMFENIHPFVDFNGRSGRCLYNIHRLKLGLPIHTIKADWPDKEGEQYQYYQWFK